MHGTGSGRHRIEIEPSVDHLGRVRDFVESQLRNGGFPPGEAGELVLAVDEAVSNVVEHGFRGRGGKITVDVAAGPEGFTVRICDDAPLFDPTQGDDSPPSVPPLQRHEPGGYGLLLVRRLVDRLSYRVAEDGRNELSLLKRRQ